jgi:hypothetical protein
MSDPKSPDETSSHDRLLTRPDPAPLPTTLDPAGPESRGYPADPKPDPSESPGLPGKGGLDKTV